MRRLNVQLYLGFVAVLMLSFVLAGLAWWALAGFERDHHPSGLLAFAAAVGTELVPAPGSDRSQLLAGLERLRSRLGVDLALYGPDRTLLAHVGGPLPPLAPERGRSGWLRNSGGALALALVDERWLVLRHPGHGGRGGWWLGALLLLAVAIGLGCYPLARRLTGRLERLQQRVERLGAGELSTRVEVEGRDEIARLAGSFNRAVGRIEELVEAQRSVLAGASHDLRTPLTRIRVASELLAGADQPASRATLAARVAADIELLGLAAEEAARCSLLVESDGAASTVHGDRRMLRRLVRNLLDNARRHGDPDSVEIALSSDGAQTALSVTNRGSAIPEGERERIFEPFHRAGRGAPGSGLGLALARRIAERHGGTVHCTESSAQRTRFEVRLPNAG